MQFPITTWKQYYGTSTVKMVESYLFPVCGGHSLHNKTNDDRKQRVNFALGRHLTLTGTLYQHKDFTRSPSNQLTTK